MQQQQRASYLPQLQFDFTTSRTFNGFIPASVNNYIQQIQHLPVVKTEIYEDGASYYQIQPEGFVEQQYHQSPIIKAEQQQWRNSSPCTPVPVKTVTSIPASSGAEIAFRTGVDTLMKAIQAKSNTAQPQPESSPFQWTRPVVSTPSLSMHGTLRYRSLLTMKFRVRLHIVKRIARKDTCAPSMDVRRASIRRHTLIFTSEHTMETNPM